MKIFPKFFISVGISLIVFGVLLDFGPTFTGAFIFNVGNNSKLTVGNIFIVSGLPLFFAGVVTTESVLGKLRRYLGKDDKESELEKYNLVVIGEPHQIYRGLVQSEKAVSRALEYETNLIRRLRPKYVFVEEDENAVAKAEHGEYSPSETLMTKEVVEVAHSVGAKIIPMEEPYARERGSIALGKEMTYEWARKYLSGVRQLLEKYDPERINRFLQKNPVFRDALDYALPGKLTEVGITNENRAWLLESVTKKEDEFRRRQEYMKMSIDAEYKMRESHWAHVIAKILRHAPNTKSVAIVGNAHIHEEEGSEFTKLLKEYEVDFTTKDIVSPKAAKLREERYRG